jgi:hypothetical protein
MSKSMRWIALSIVCTAVVGVAATAAIARTSILLSVTTPKTAPLATAIDDPLFQTSQANGAFTKESAAGAAWARILVQWQDIAPGTLPHTWNPGDPNSPFYKWAHLDNTVTAATAHHVQLFFDIVSPPGWAYDVKPAGWTGGRPKAGMLATFAKALARRYNGTAHPAVRAFSVWNEPNFNHNLFPQNSPNPNNTAEAYYRTMVNGVADAVHAVNPLNLALAGELAPFKHTQTSTDKNNVIPPIDFMRAMLCLSSTTPVHRTCSTVAKFDVWTHHPYSDTGPYGKATGAGGVELGDLPKMDALLKTAWKLGAIQTEHGTHITNPSAPAPPFWVTEIGWSSKPPNTKGVPMALETRWVGESFYQLWRSGATLGTWFLVQDEKLNTPFQSGLYLNSPSIANAKLKPLLAPFRMPFVAYLKSGGKVSLWGRDATSTAQNVTISMKTGSAWKAVATIMSNSYGIFQATLPLNAKSTYSMRASAGGVTSATFSLTVPPNENLKVTPFPFS